MANECFIQDDSTLDTYDADRLALGLRSAPDV